MQDVNLRDIALTSVVDILENGQYSHIYLNNVLEKYAYLEKSKRSFITRIVSGTIERKIELDYIINSVSKTKTNKMKPVIKNILRLGAYEIYYMDSIPDSATCNEYVKLAKKRGFSGLSGFVNGVLRGIIRGMNKLTIADEAVLYSMPDDIYKVLIRDYGKELAKSIAASFFKPAPLTIRIDESKISVDEMVLKLADSKIGCQIDERIPYCLYLTGIDRVESLPGYNEGMFYVQDYSSMLVGYLALSNQSWSKQSISNKSSDIINALDVCAAPGGKALHIASLIKGKIEARDLTDTKVALIEENIKRSGLTNITAKKWDATVHDDELVGKCDLLVCDLPCSGLGIIRKKPDIKYNTSLEDMTSLVKLQEQILDTVQDYVSAGGVLMYSTCTLNKDENERQVKRFLDKYSEFSLIQEETVLPCDKNHTRDGFYVAKLMRNK